MARADNDYGFTAIRVEGGLLPPEYLQTINALQATHQASTDYGLTRSLNIKDEIGRYWRMAMDLWADYRERRQRTDLDLVQVAVDEWLLPLFEHILGYHDITPCMPVTIGERHFPIGHKACGKTVPLILTGHRYDLDKAELRFGDAGRRRPPYGLLQEYLNADDACLWGMVSNGNLVRLARDNPSLTRPAFIEADLERMFEEQLFADFAAFWLLLHVSRVAPHEGSPAQCLLEAWRTESLETGERVRAKLRLGVTAALRQFGNGFLEHRANEDLRHALSTGEITEADYFQELLRLVYRLLFLFTVEDRNLLFHPETSGEEQRLYTEGYSLSRLRDRALRRRHYDRHSDLWDGLLVICRGLASGVEPLGLPALGGLFADDQCPQLDACAITNGRLLQAIRALAFFDSGKALARVNYRDMGTEELGSVYESLLELHPTIAVAPWTFGFIGDDQEANLRGSERKTTGSYYTPPVLVNELIKSALVPVIERTLKDNPERPREALLGLKIVDPACGSGHFLLAVARQVAAEVARLDAGLDTPDEALRQHVLREVVQHCVYGVDKNPLAVELCKTALWIETIEPGKPLSFLDAHIRCGDSLVGILDTKIMEDGIPDDAYKPLPGDERAIANALKRRNRQAGESIQGSLFDPESLKPIAVASFDLGAMPEDTLEQIEMKRRAWNKAQGDQALQQQELKANLFVGAFFVPKTKENAEKVPLTEDLNRLSKGLPQRPGLVEATRLLAQRYGFFHWPLVFPEVCARGGFDVVLGNPPWEKLQTEELQFFAVHSPTIASLKGAKRKSAIKALQDINPALAAKWHEQIRTDAATIGFIRNSGTYPLTGVGKFNTFALFAELNNRVIAPTGRVGCIVPSGIATDDTTKLFFQHIITSNSLVSLFDFENRDAIFPGVHRSYKFCLLTLTGKDRPVKQGAEFVFFAHSVEALRDEQRRFTLTSSDIALLNPNTLTCATFRSRRDAAITTALYQRVPIFLSESKPQQNAYQPQVWRLLNTTDDSEDFADFSWERRDELVPVIEAKTIHQFDHRFATFATGSDTAVEIPAEAKASLNLESLARYYVTDRLFRGRMPEPLRDKRWFLTARNIARSTDERTVIAAIIPRGASCEVTPYIETNGGAQVAAFLLGLLNSFVLDYVARQKVGGTHLSYFILYQLPILFPHQDLAMPFHFFVSRVLELTYTAYNLQGFAADCGYTGEPFRWDEERRFLLRCELDAAYFHLYGIARDDVDYVMETFPIVKRKDEARFGEYRTKRVILGVYDTMQRAITTGEPYRTLLDPPPADSRIAHEAKAIYT